jgi:hypothetical protein
VITDDCLIYDDMVSLIRRGERCGDCGGLLVISWGGYYGYEGYILRCAFDINHSTITRHDMELENKLREANLDSKALTTMDENTMVKRIGMAKFPQDLKANEIQLLAKVAINYGFDPLMGEVSIYQGRPFVSIDGRYRAAQETGRLDGVESRPASKQERADWEIPDGDYFFRSDVHVKGCGFPFTGWGRVRKEETQPRKDKPGDYYKPVVTNPQRMAEKRAEAQALRKAFHIPLPSFEDIGTPDADVIDSTGTILPDDLPFTGRTEINNRDVNKIKTITGLQDALLEDFSLNNTSQLAELGIKNWAELRISPAEAYQQIAAVRK